MTGPRPVRDPLAEIEARLGVAADPADDPLTAIERRLEGPQATVTMGPVTPVGVPASEIERLSKTQPRTRSTAADIGMSAARGLAESGYGTIQGAANLLDRLPLVDGLSEAVRGSREEMRQFYGDPESTAGKATMIGSGIVGAGAQFMVPGAALARGSAALGAAAEAGTMSKRAAKAAKAMGWLANPLGPGGAAREAAGRVIGGTVLNTPLNLAVSQSPEDASATFIGEVTGNERLKNANALERFAVETGMDLAGNAVFEGVAKGAGAINRSLTERSPGFITLPKRERVPRAPAAAAAVPPAPTPAEAVVAPETPTPRAGEVVPPAATDPLVAIEAKLGVEPETAPVTSEASAPPAPVSAGPDVTPKGDAPTVPVAVARGAEPRAAGDYGLPQALRDAYRGEATDAEIIAEELFSGTVWDRTPSSAMNEAQDAIARFADEFIASGEPLTKLRAAAREYAKYELSRKSAVKAFMGSVDAFLAKTADARPVPGRSGEIPTVPVSRENTPPAATKMEDAKTGQPLTVTLMRGEGGTREGTRGDLSILGPGRYTTSDKEYAGWFAQDDAGKEVGKVVEVPVSLKNPLVITSDAEWLDLTKKAGWQHANPGNPAHMDATALAAHKQAIARLRKVVEDAGHDGVVVRIPTFMDGGYKMVDERYGKLLDRVFGADQVLEFNPPKANKPEAKRTAVGGTPGRAATVTLSDGSKLKTRYRVVEADELISSHSPSTFQPDPRYPEGVQGRDYAADKTIQEVVRSRALQLDPDLALDPSVSADKGPPIITGDGLVIAGNERSMLVRLADELKPDKAAAYRAALAERAAEFGLTPEAVAGMKRPVLVREIVDEGVKAGDTARLAELNRLSDTPDTKAKRAQDDAASRAAALRQAKDALEHFTATIEPDETLADYLGRAEGKQFVRKLVEDRVLAPQEVTRFADPNTGTLTEEGKGLVRRMMLAAAVDRPDVAPAGILQKLEHAVPHLATVRGTGEWDITATLQRALDVLGDARARGVKLDDLLGQGSMFGDAVDEATAKMARWLDRSKKADITKTFRDYAVKAREAAARAQADDMFGDLADSPMSAQTVFASPAPRRGKPRASDPSLFSEGTTGDLFGGAPTMGESTVGMRASTPPAPKPGDAQQANDLFNSLIGEDELRARRDELGFERKDIPGADDEGQGALFAPAGRGAPPPASGPTPAGGPAPGPLSAPRMSRLELMGLSRELATELAASALGAGVGAAAAPEGERQWGALYGAVGAFGGTKAAFALGRNLATLRALREDAKPLISISRNLAAAVGVPLRQGRFMAVQRRALGVFFPKSEVTRVIRYDMVDTAAHEVGHYVSKKYLGNPTMRRGRKVIDMLPSEVRRELVDAGRALYGDRKPAGGYGEEGIAEFFKHYVTKPDELPAKFAATTEWMRGKLANEPALTAALDQARTDFARYKESPASKRIAAMISVDERVRNAPTLTDYLRAGVDDLVDIERAVTTLAEMGKKPTARNAYTLARLTRGSAGAAEEMMERGIEIGGERVTTGLAPALRSIPDADWQAFREYLVAERALELDARGIKSGVDVRAAREVVARDAARFKDAAEAVWAHSQALIDLRVEAGLLTPDEAKVIKAQNQKRVPFYRVFEDGDLPGSSGMGGPKARNSSGLHAIKGSARRIVDPLESLISDTYKTVRQAREHEAATTLITHALATEGGGRVAELVPPPQIRQSFRVDRQTVEQMLDLGMIDEPTAEEILSGIMTGDVAGRLSGFTTANMAGAAERKDMVVPVILKGERKWVQIGDADLYRTLMNMNKEELSAWQRAVSLPTRTLRTGATLTLGFIARNPLRDLGTAFIRTRAGRPVLPGEHLVRGVFSMLKRDELYQAWRLTGGDNATMLGLDRATTQKHLLDLRATAAQKGWNLVTKPVDTLRLLSSISENATRLGEYKLVYARALREGRSVADARALAAYAARDISTDFAKAGTVGRQVNMIVEFVNATIQGNVNLVKDLRERPGTVLPRAIAGVTIPSVALYLAQREDPVYQEVPQYVKDVAWVVVWPPLFVRRARKMADSEATVAIIPKPFEWGIALGTVPEKLAQFVGERDPRALRQATDALIKGFAPNVIPTAVKPFIENYANESFFMRRPIVPRDKEGEDPWAQASPRTGETARLVGKALNYSPAKVENVARGYGGGLGMEAVRLSDRAIRMGRDRLGMEPLRPVLPKNEQGAFGTPGLSAFMRPAPGTDAESIQRFYEESDAAERARQTYKGLLAEGRPKAAMDYLKAHLSDVVAMGTDADFGTGALREQRAQMTELRGMLREINTSKMSDAEKRAATAKVEQAMVALAQSGVAANRTIQTATRARGR